MSLSNKFYVDYFHLREWAAATLMEPRVYDSLKLLAIVGLSFILRDVWVVIDRDSSYLRRMSVVFYPGVLHGR